MYYFGSRLVLIWDVFRLRFGVDLESIWEVLGVDFWSVFADPARNGCPDSETESGATKPMLFHYAPTG